MRNTNNLSSTPTVPAILSWLFPYKKKGLSVSTGSALRYYLFQNKISLLLINWLFQGMRSMGTADLTGKVIFEILFFGFFLFIFNGSLIYRITISLIAAHTVNWLINAHFWDLGRFMGITRTSPNRFFPYLRKMMSRISQNNSIVAIIVIGGVSRNAGFRETSDVDMIFIRGKGFKNAVRSVLVTVRERFSAFFRKFPLHVELYENMSSVRHRNDEVPIVLKDVGNIVSYWYKKTGGITRSLDDFDNQT